MGPEAASKGIVNQAKDGTKEDSSDALSALSMSPRPSIPHEISDSTLTATQQPINKLTQEDKAQAQADFCQRRRDFLGIKDDMQPLRIPGSIDSMDDLRRRIAFAIAEDFRMHEVVGRLQEQYAGQELILQAEYYGVKDLVRIQQQEHSRQHRR